MEIHDLAAMSPRDVAAVRVAIEPLRNLGDPLEWARHLEPPVPSPLVVTQDEYTHDVLIPCAHGRWLDFDTT